MDKLIKHIQDSSKCTNCYENMDNIIEKLNITSTNTINNLQDLKKKIIKNLTTKLYVLYRINLNISGLHNKRKMIYFNHSFGIIQYSENFILCDSWDSIHFNKCRICKSWIIFEKWINSFIDKITHVIINNELNNMYELFSEDPFSLEKIDNFKEDYKILEEMGQYIEEWEQLNKLIIINSPFVLLEINEYHFKI